MDELTGGATAPPFRFRVDGAFTISNRRGVWLSGEHEPGCGPVRVGDELVLHDPAGPARPVTVISWGDGRRADDQGRPGVFFAVAVTGVGADEVRPGMLLASPGAGQGPAPC